MLHNLADPIKVLLSGNVLEFVKVNAFNHQVLMARPCLDGDGHCVVFHPLSPLLNVTSVYLHVDMGCFIFCGIVNEIERCVNMLLRLR